MTTSGLNTTLYNFFDWIARRRTPVPSDEEAWGAFAQLEAERNAARQALAAASWNDTDRGNNLYADWLANINASDWRPGAPLTVPRRPMPWDDFLAAGASPTDALAADFYTYVIHTTWDRLNPGVPYPTDRYNAKLLEIQTAFVALQHDLVTSQDMPITDFDAALLARFNDPKDAAYYLDPELQGVWQTMKEGLALSDDPNILLANITRAPIAPTAVTSIGNAPPGPGSLAAPPGNMLTQPATGNDVPGLDALYAKLSSRPSFPATMRSDAAGNLSPAFVTAGALLQAPGLNSTTARQLDQQYGTSVFTEWYNYTVATPGFLSDTSSPQSVREQVATALTHLTGVLNASQRAELADNADALAAMWRDEMASLPDEDGGDFRLQTPFVDWLRANANRFIPDLDIEIANDAIVSANARSVLSPLGQQLVDMGVSLKAADDLSFLLTRQPSETFRDYTARLQTYMPQIIAVGQAAYARDPARYRDFYESVFGEVEVGVFDPISGEPTRERRTVETGKALRPGAVLSYLADYIDPMLADIWRTAAEGDGPDAEIARRALSSTDPADTRAAVIRFGRVKELQSSLPFGPVSYEMADDPSVASIPLEFLAAMRTHAMSVTAGLPAGAREVAVERILSKASKFYSAFLQSEARRQASLPESERDFGGVPRDEFTSIVEGAESARTTPPIQFVDPRIMQTEKDAVAAERGLSNIWYGDPEDMVEVADPTTGVVSQRRRQDVINEIGETARERALVTQTSIVAAGGPETVVDAATGKTTQTPLGSYLSFVNQVGAYTATQTNPRPLLAEARQRRAGQVASQFAPQFFQGFGLVARRLANDAFPDFDLEIGGMVGGGLGSQRRATSTIAPRRRR